MTDTAIATIVAAMIGLVGIILAALIQRTHALVNSRMQELLDLTREAAHAEGVKNGHDEEEGRT